MFILNSIFDVSNIIKTVQTKNYVVDDYENPPTKQIITYRSKKLKDGTVLRFAILKTTGPNGGRTKLVSKWNPK